MNKEDLLPLINSGYSQREMAKELECSQSNVKYWLKKLNLKTNIKQHNKKYDLSNGEKSCSKCESTKPLSEFYLSDDRYSSYCKNCHNEYQVKRFQNNKIKMIEYKGGECEDCSLKVEDSHPNVFEFHHLDPNEKDIDFIHIKVKKWDIIKLELDKCILLCANCHRLRHAIEYDMKNKFSRSIGGDAVGF